MLTRLKTILKTHVNVEIAFIVSFSILLGILTYVGIFVLTGVQKRELINNIKEKAVYASQSIGQHLEIEFMLEDRAQLDGVIDKAMSIDQDLYSIRMYNGDEVLIAGQGTYPESIKLEPTKDYYLSETDNFITCVNVIHDGEQKVIGFMVLVYDLTEVHNSVSLLVSRLSWIAITVIFLLDILLFTAIFEIRKRDRKAALRKSNEILELKAQEKERLRISKEIHDSLGQILFATRMRFNSYSKIKDDVKHLRWFSEVDQMLDSMIYETRIIINNLGISLFENSTCRASVEDLILKTGKIFNGKILLSWKGDDDLADKKRAFNCFRILQEVLTNAIKYSKSELIEIEFDNQASLRMRVKDYGIGFDMHQRNESNSFGLNNIQIRAKQIDGKIEIRSSPGEGTEVMLTLNH